MAKAEPARWAIERVLKESGSGWTYTTFQHFYNTPLVNVAACSVAVAAHYVEKYEEPPVDPDILLAREVVAADYRANRAPNYADSIVKGDCDGLTSMRVAVATIRRVRAEGLPSA